MQPPFLQSSPPCASGAFWRCLPRGLGRGVTEALSCGSGFLSASLLASLALVVSDGLAAQPAGTQPSSAAKSAPAQAPAALALERASFLRQTLTDSQLLTEQYERALAKVESELAATGDYEEARLVQQRRAELRALYPNSDSSLAQALATPLLPALARFTGSAEARGEVLTGWRTGGSTAEWSNIRIAPGRYNLEMEVNMVDAPTIQGSLAPGRSQPQDSAAMEFYEVSLLPGAQENRRSFDIAANQDDTTFTPMRIGPVNFTRSPVTVRLTTAAGYPGNVIRLRNARLVPVTGEVIAKAPSATVADSSIDEMRKTLGQALASAQKTVMEGYLAKLRAVAKESPALGDETDAEIKRVLKMMDAGRNGGGAPLLRLFSTPAGVGGFEDVDGAHYAADPKNSGDRFFVEQGDRRILVRLLWVQCAPLNAKDGSRKAFAKHFGIDDDATPALARAAQEFTAGYLEGKTLRLLIRPGKDKDGSVAALVFLPEVGLYQNALIDQGLAYVETAIKNTRRPAIERAMLGALLDREQKARKQKTGAWALTPEDAAP